MGIDDNESDNPSTPENPIAFSGHESALSLESGYGSVKASAHPEDWNQVTRKAKNGKAEATLGKLEQTRKS